LTIEAHANRTSRLRCKDNFAGWRPRPVRKLFPDAKVNVAELLKR